MYLCLLLLKNYSDNSQNTSKNKINRVMFNFSYAELYIVHVCNFRLTIIRRKTTLLQAIKSTLHGYANIQVDLTKYHICTRKTKVHAVKVDLIKITHMHVSFLYVIYKMQDNCFHLLLGQLSFPLQLR